MSSIPVSIISHITTLPGVKYLAEIVAQGTDEPGAEGVFAWILTGEYKKGTLNDRTLLRYLDNKNEVVNDILTVLIYFSRSKLKLAETNQVIFKLISDHPEVKTILERASVVRRTSKDQILLYLAEFILTGKDPYPVVLMGYIKKLIVDPAGVCDFVIRSFRN